MMRLTMGLVVVLAGLAAPASGQGVFPFKIEDATYSERVGAPLWGEFTGSDIDAAETVFKSATKSLNDPDISFTYTTVAMSKSKGPEAAASVDISSAISDPGTASASAWGAVQNEFYLVVYNRMGTPTSQLVPLLFKTEYDLSLSCSGEVSYAACAVWMHVWPAEGGPRIWGLSDTLSRDDEADRIIGAPPTKEVQIQVGNAPLSYYKMKVIQGANARGDVHAWANWDMEDPRTGTVEVSSWIDPAIYIDPEWEYADDFGLAFSPNMQPVSEPYPGDANYDGATDLSDFNIWNANKFTAPTSWRTGDFNSDGTTDLSDFNIWNAHKFTIAGGGVAPVPVEVPEPGVVVLLAVAAAFALITRRRRPGWAVKRSRWSR